jgi:hypothetical protein
MEKNIIVFPMKIIQDMCQRIQEGKRLCKKAADASFDAAIKLVRGTV